MGKAKITIEDIAREAGVGIGTVSRVLNNSAHVAEDTRKRVLDVIKARQYVRSAAAAKLARNNVVETTVGLLLPDIGNHYFFEIFEAIYQKFRGLGIDLIIFNYEKHNPKVIQRVLDAQLSALLIFAFHLVDSEREMLHRHNVPYLYIDYPSESEHCIYTDNIQGGRIAAQYLHSRGVTNPCYIAVDPPAWANEERLAGFVEEYQKFGVSSISTFSSVLTEEEGYRVAEEIIASGKHDGIFCYCDDIAAGAIRAVRKHNASISVIGFDGVRATDYLDLSTVSQEPQMIGELASSLIIKLIEGGNGQKPIRELITPVLINRGS